MTKSLFWAGYIIDDSRTSKPRLENVEAGVISWQLIIIKLWTLWAHQGHWWQNRGLCYNGGVWAEIGQHQRECCLIASHSVCSPPQEHIKKTLWVREGYWCACFSRKSRVKYWFGSPTEGIDHGVQNEFMTRVAIRKLLVYE